MIKEIVRVERKRILNRKIVILMIGVIFFTTIYEGLKIYKGYEVYDQKGNIEISAKKNLEESKRHSLVLNRENLVKIIERKNKSRYFYNTNTVRLILENFKDKKFNEITEEDLENFYLDRTKNIVDINKKKQERSSGELRIIEKKASELDSPLEIGYVEGWKNLNNNMGNFIFKLLIFLSLILIAIFSKDQKTKMEELCKSSRNGRKTLVKSKFIVGFQVGLIVYMIGIIIYSGIYLSIFGIGGADLKIQNTVGYFNSIQNLTYLQQFILNGIFGLAAVFLVVSIVLLITNLAKQSLTAGITITFFWIILIMVPKGLKEVHYYILNFLPYNITDFNGFYLKNEFYNIGGVELMGGIATLIVVNILIFVVTTIAYGISIKKVKR